MNHPISVSSRRGPVLSPSDSTGTPMRSSIDTYRLLTPKQQWIANFQPGELLRWTGLNKLYYGDNLTVLKNCFDDESVDLIYLDPPFNSQATYNVLFKSTAGEQSRAQIEAFEDTWHWGDEAALAFDGVMTSGNSDAAEMLRAMRSFLKENDMMAYLSMMAVRLLELHRVLKPTGSLYLHCDPTASHYLKVLMDGIFGAVNFRNEVIWKRNSAHSDAKQRARHYGRLTDSILFYSKGDNPTWKTMYRPLRSGIHRPGLPARRSRW